MKQPWELEIDGRVFFADATVDLGDQAFRWSAVVQLDGREIGTVRGTIERRVMAATDWEAERLSRVAYFDAREAILTRDGVDW